MPYTPCANEYGALKTAYAAWQKKYDASKEGEEDYWQAHATAVTVCGGALFLTGTTVVGGIFGGAACALAIWRAWDKLDDARKLVSESNAANDASVAASDAYRACANKHKLAQANAGAPGEAEAIDEPDAGSIPAGSIPDEP